MGTTLPMTSAPAFLDPFVSLVGGYDVHLYFPLPRRSEAIAILDGFKAFLSRHDVNPSFSFVYDEPPNFEGGPHLGPMWVVQLMGVNPARDVPRPGGNAEAVRQIGLAVAWIQLNRGDFTVLVHPNVAKPFGDVAGEIVDHTAHAVWLGVPTPPVLSIAFFEGLLLKDAATAGAEAKVRLAALHS
eukprot:c46503_g1_i1.p1 GENE.c46503_g1_i1~~c46503_g1_i1.p1  ORF type:complete len:185 (+),score=26.50 c46503_g1_i1:3-557(+)